MGLSKSSQCWRMPDELWDKVQPLLPPGKPHPLGCHRSRVDDRKAMDAIFYRLRTGCQWKALDATGICSGSSTHRRFKERTGPHPTDRAKRGVKRSLLVEGHGIPIGLAVEGANRNDFKMGRATLESLPIERPKPTPEEPQHLCLDKGYDYDEVRE